LLLTNLDKLKSQIQEMGAEEFASLVYDCDNADSVAAEFNSCTYCNSIDDCLDISCKECFVRFLKQEALS
jgi:hypothetical protein